MQLKRFVEIISESLEKTRLKQETAHDQHHFIAIESIISIVNLKRLLSQLAQSDAEVTQESIQPLVDFMSARYRAIKNTDASYLINFYSHANQVCFEMAKRLSGIFPGRSAYSYLIPTLHSGITFDAPLNKYILSDNEETLIEISKCLLDAKVDGKYKHTHPVSKSLTLLSDTEKHRVCHFMAKAKSFSEAMITRNPTLIEKAANQFKKEISKDASLKPHSIGSIDSNFLSANIQLKSFNELIEVMTHPDVNDWEAFTTICPQDQLKKIIFTDQSSSYEQSISANLELAKNEKQYQAVLYATAACYVKERATQFKHTTSSPTLFGYATAIAGEVVGYMVGSFTRDEKIRSGKILMHFIMQKDTDNLDEFFDIAFKKSHGDEFKDDYANQLARHKAAICDHDLGSITKLAKIKFSQFAPTIEAPKKAMGM